MDSAQLGADGLFGALLTVLGWLVNAVRGDAKSLRRDHDELVKGLPETYARRDDMQDAYNRLLASQVRTEDKIDRIIERMPRNG